MTKPLPPSETIDMPPHITIDFRPARGTVADLCDRYEMRRGAELVVTMDHHWVAAGDYVPIEDDLRAIDRWFDPRLSRLLDSLSETHQDELLEDLKQSIYDALAGHVGRMDVVLSAEVEDD